MSEHIQIYLTTKLSQFNIPNTPLSVPLSISNAELNKLVNGLIDTDQLHTESVPTISDDTIASPHTTSTNNNKNEAVRFDFLISGELLRTTLEEFIKNNSFISTEKVIEIECIQKFPAPVPIASLNHPDWVSSVRILDNNILTGAYDGMLRISTKTDKFRITTEFKCHNKPITCVRWVKYMDDYTSYILATASLDCTVKLWEWNRNSNDVTYLCTGMEHNESIQCLAVSPDKTHLSTSSWDRLLKIWTLENTNNNNDDDDNIDNDDYTAKKSKRNLSFSLSTSGTLEGHTDTVTWCEWNRDSRIITGSWDHDIKLWDIETLRPVRTLKGNKAIQCISENPFNGLIASCCSDNSVKIWNTDSSESTILKMILRGHTAWSWRVKWSDYNEFQLVSGSHDGTMKQWDLRSPTIPLYTVGAHKRKLLDLDWIDKSLLVSGGNDGQLKIHICS